LINALEDSYRLFSVILYKCIQVYRTSDRRENIHWLRWALLINRNVNTIALTLEKQWDRQTAVTNMYALQPV